MISLLPPTCPILRGRRSTILAHIPVDSASLIVLDATLTDKYDKGTFHSVRHVCFSEQGRDYILYCKMHYRQEEVEAIHPDKTVIGFQTWNHPIAALGGRTANDLVAKRLATEWLDPRAHPEFSQAGYEYAIFNGHTTLSHKGTPVAFPVYCRCDGLYTLRQYAVPRQLKASGASHLLVLKNAFPLEEDPSAYLGDITVKHLAIGDPRFLHKLDDPNVIWKAGNPSITTTLTGHPDPSDPVPATPFRIHGWKQDNSLILLLFPLHDPAGESRAVTQP